MKGSARNNIKVVRRKDENKELYDKWRKKVYQRDDYTCQKCGAKQKLEAHHIVNFSSDKHLRYNVDNGITFCKKDHETFHKIYGKEDNNKEQVEVFIFRKLERNNKLF